MKKSQELAEVAMIAVILGDHFTEKLYEEMQKRGTGYISTVEEIGKWAVEFYRKHRKTNWENALENEMKPLSKEMKSVICYDEAILDFGFFKLNQFK